MFVSYEFMAAIVYGFSTYILLSKGFNTAEIGICMGIANCQCITIMPWASNFLDKSKKYNTLDLLAVASLLLVIVSIGHYYFRSANLFTAILFIIVTGLFSFMEPFTNVVNFEFTNKGVEVPFGIARAIGSAAYGVTCAVLGIVSNKSPYTVLLLASLFAAISLFIIMFLLRKELISIKSDNIVKKEETISLKEFVQNHKIFLVLLIFLTGIYLGYTCIDNFLLLVAQNVGGNSGTTGTVLGTKAGVEFIFIMLYSKIEKKLGVNKVLKISAFFFIIKCLTYYLAKSVITLYVAQAFQSLSFATMLPAMVSFVNMKMDKREAVRGQSCFTMTICLGAIFSSVIGGNIANSYGVESLLLFALIVTIVSSLGFIYFVDKQ